MSLKKAYSEKYSVKPSDRSQGEGRMTKGTIKWFNTKKGFGFIRQERGDDVFFNHHSIKLNSPSKLNVGDPVIFEIDEELLGLSAKNVQRI